MVSFFDLSSLRGKITSAYVALVASTAVLAVIAVSDLLFLERQLAEGEVVSDLRDVVLEMRREEKNLFLYGDTQVVSRVDEQAGRALDLLERHQTVLGRIMPKSDPTTMTERITAYRRELTGWARAESSARQSLQEQLRTLGHQVYLSVESLSSEERRLLEGTVRESKWFLLISLLLIGLAFHIVGRQLKWLVITPLKQLESRLMPIAKGRFDHLRPPSTDREFVAFTKAFNLMLRELQIRQKRMLQTEKLASLGILASGVAHELNNPLSNISSSCQLLMEELDEADPAQLRAWLEQIDSETERGRVIVRTLLDFGRQRVFEKSPVRLADLANEARLIVGKTLQQCGAKLSLNVPTDLQIPVDKHRFLQLFINLIQNSLHAGGPGLHISISATGGKRGAPILAEDAQVAGNLQCISGQEGEYVEILVGDDGPGIPEQDLSKVFDPFFTTSEPGKGVGLGLFIVQEIVREHDGCLAIASRPGIGTRVIILLPGVEAAGD